MTEFGAELSEAILRTGDPMEEARDAMSAETHAATVERGRQMSVEEVVTFALAGT